MIRRIRRPGPDGDLVMDRDLGPGPVGRMSMPGDGHHLRGTTVAQSVEARMPRLGLAAGKHAKARLRALELGQ